MINGRSSYCLVHHLPPGKILIIDMSSMLAGAVISVGMINKSEGETGCVTHNVTHHVTHHATHADHALANEIIICIEKYTIPDNM